MEASELLVWLRVDGDDGQRHPITNAERWKETDKRDEVSAFCCLLRFPITKWVARARVELPTFWIVIRMLPILF